jgi:hypothetical protein
VLHGSNRVSVDLYTDGESATTGRIRTPEREVRELLESNRLTSTFYFDCCYYAIDSLWMRNTWNCIKYYVHWMSWHDIRVLTGHPDSVIWTLGIIRQSVLTFAWRIAGSFVVLQSGWQYQPSFHVFALGFTHTCDSVLKEGTHRLGSNPYPKRKNNFSFSYLRVDKVTRVLVCKDRCSSELVDSSMRDWLAV